MSAEVKIHPVQANEATLLLALSRKTFFDAFAHRNQASDMESYAAANFTIEKLKAELDNPNSYFYFAMLDDKPVGYLKLNVGPAQTDLQDANALEVERIYISANFQGKQIGARLLEFAIASARQRQANYIWLGVWEHNTQAIKFYQRQGFTTFGSHPFMLGTDCQTDVLMKLGLLQ